MTVGTAAKLYVLYPLIRASTSGVLKAGHVKSRRLAGLPATNFRRIFAAPTPYVLE